MHEVAHTWETEIASFCIDPCHVCVLFFAQFFVVPTSIDYSSSLQTNYWQLSHLGCVCCDVTQSFVKERKKNL